MASTTPWFESALWPKPSPRVGPIPPGSDAGSASGGEPRADEARCGRARVVPPFALALLVSILCIPSLSANADGFAIDRVRAYHDDGVYYLDAEAQLEFSEKALEALTNGVALTVRIEMQVVRARRFWVDAKVADLSADYRLELHALSKQYVVRNLNLGTSQSYPTLASARAAIGSLQKFPLVDAHLLSSPGEYAVRIRARLDIEALPAPLRPLAYLSSLWRLDSDWSQWPIPR